jgi:pyridinium-3,5-bisthiocarboxylic acid mononucleotide nickel chelatase
VVELLTGAPVFGRAVPVELTTPTGAALLVGLDATFGPLPAMTIAASGFGAGGRDLEVLPNCCQVIVGTLEEPSVGPGQPVMLVETNVDDVTGEQLGRTLEALLAAGAHDAWISAVVMKKGRPGHVVHALVDPAGLDAVRRTLSETTGTFGTRATGLERWPQARTTVVVEVEGHPVRVKAGANRVKPEFDDVVRVAEQLGRSVDEVSALAQAAWRRAYASS